MKKENKEINQGEVAKLQCDKCGEVKNCLLSEPQGTNYTAACLFCIAQTAGHYSEYQGIGFSVEYDLAGFKKDKEEYVECYFCKTKDHCCIFKASKEVREKEGIEEAPVCIFCTVYGTENGKKERDRIRDRKRNDE